MNLLPPFAHRQITYRPHIESVQGEHQEHLCGPPADTPKTSELGHDMVILIVRRSCLKVQLARLHSVRQLGDGAHLCPG